jgi:hypothetical protein
MLKVNYQFICFIFLVTGTLLAQNNNEINPYEFTVDKINDPGISLSGNFQIDKRILIDAAEPQFQHVKLNPQSEDNKSPWLGALFSLIVPGSGEVYAESYWKAGIFVAIEAAVITTAIVYNNKGNKATDDFEKFADNVSNNTGWSAVRYAKWLNQNYNGHILIDTIPSRPQWEWVNFDDIHAVEVQYPELSHQLAYHGEQQYYEMIGKYHQFRAGWADYTPDLGFNVSPLFHKYTGMRATANNYFSTASTAVVGIYINHFLSAIDAYWSTTIYNKELVAKITVKTAQYDNVAELVPTLNIKFSF